MKVVKEVVVREETRYIAEDGMVFFAEAECKRHEKDIARADLKAKLELIEFCDAADDNPPVDGGEYYEYNSYRWYRPKTMEEAQVLVEWYELDTCMTEEDIGQWICIENSEDGYAAWYHNIVHSIKYVKRLFDLLGYDVTIMKVGDSNV